LVLATAQGAVLDTVDRIADGQEFADGIASFFEKRAPQFAK
jgi:hypothetical protein